MNAAASTAFSPHRPDLRSSVRTNKSAPRGKVVATLPKFEGLKLRDLKIEGGAVRFTVANEGNSFQVVAYPPKGDDDKKWYATVQGPKELMLGRLEPSDQDELKERDEVSVEEGFDLFAKFTGKGDKRKIEVLKEVMERYPGKPVAIVAGQQLLDKLADLGEGSEDELRSIAKNLVDSTKNYGREMEIQILPPDVNASEWSFTPDGTNSIRFGLGAVKNVGQGAVEAIVAARSEGDRFTSIFDFCERVNLSAVNRRVIESLIKAGAIEQSA